MPWQAYILHIVYSMAGRYLIYQTPGFSCWIVGLSFILGRYATRNSPNLIKSDRPYYKRYSTYACLTGLLCNNIDLSIPNAGHGNIRYNYMLYIYNVSEALYKHAMRKEIV